ncbi:MAG: hypothetical protein GY722_25785 [bacterium]|nr:hypothetical protein [bacterium]
MPKVNLTPDLSYYLIAFDSDGRERSDDPDGMMSDLIAAELAAGRTTDVYILSHGWRGDIPAAKKQYDKWISAMAAMNADRDRLRSKRAGYRALVVGFHWPSEPWGEEDFEDVDFAGRGTDLDTLVDRWAARIADTPAAREALRTILTSAAEDLLPPVMPDAVRDAYLALDREAGLAADGPGAAPGADREGFDPVIAYEESFGDDFGLGFSLGGLLTPLKQLSFWKMKARARSIGEGGGHSFLERLLSVPGAGEVRYHLMGHSFGCIVVTSMVAGPQSGSGPSRPVSSIALVQGATSHWGYCNDIPYAPGRPGYFHRLIKNANVAGPIVVTTSNHDRALSLWYPKGAGIAGQVDFDPSRPGKYGAIGITGIQGPGVDVTNRQLATATADYGFAPGKVYNLRSDAVIKDGDFFSGGHNDIAHPEVAHAVWEAILAAP